MSPVLAKGGGGRKIYTLLEHWKLVSYSTGILSAADGATSWNTFRLEICKFLMEIFSLFVLLSHWKRRTQKMFHKFLPNPNQIIPFFCSFSFVLPVGAEDEKKAKCRIRNWITSSTFQSAGAFRLWSTARFLRLVSDGQQKPIAKWSAKASIRIINYIKALSFRPRTF